MGTNVYVSTNTTSTVVLELVQIGPTGDYTDHYHLSATSVPAGAQNVQVMTIDRAGGLHTGDAVDMAELRFSINGTFVGALTTMIDNRNEPIKNTIHWSSRVPGQSLPALNDNHDPHTQSFLLNDLQISLTTQGASSTTFDDIYVSLTAQRKTWQKILTARNSQQQQILLFATDGAGAATLQVAPISATLLPTWQDLPIALPSNDSLTAEIVIFDSIRGQSSALWIGGLTQQKRLWLQRSDQSTSTMLDLAIPIAGTPISLVVSDSFNVNGELSADLFLTVQKPDNSYRLFHRLVTLVETPSFGQASWDDWGAVSQPRPAYVTGRNNRTLYTASRALITGTEGTYYCTADIQGTSWGQWHTIVAMPDGVTPVDLLGIAWGNYDAPQDLAVICKGSDNYLYAISDQMYNAGWAKSSLVLGSGNIAAVWQSSVVNLFAHSASAQTLLGVKYWIKEQSFSSHDVHVPTDNISAFSAFFYKDDDQGSKQGYIIWQRQDAPGFANYPFQWF